MSFRIFKDTLSPSLAWQLTEGGSPLDLTGCTVKLRMRASGSATLKVDANAAVLAPASDGNVRYDWQAADTDTPGDYLAWFHVILPTSATIDSPEFPVEVVEHGEDAAWLVTVEEVREALEMVGNDSSRDRLIESLIPAASEALCSGQFPRFAPVETATAHELRWPGPGYRLELAPWLCRAVTAVTVEGVAVDAADFTAMPYGKPGGVYTHIRFGLGYTPPVSDFASEHGFYRVQVTGDWGASPVPERVKRACIVTVAAWMAAESEALGYTDLDDPRIMQPRAPKSYAIPNAAWQLMAEYQRHGYA